MPIVAKTLEKAGVFDPRRVFGVTTLDVVRAARFLGAVTGNDPNNTIVPVVGGHSGATIVPLLSHNPHGKAISGDTYAKLVHRIQFGGDEVVKAKDGAGSATLSMAYAGAKFTHALLRGLNGEKGVVTPTFVKSPLFADKGVDYFSSNVELGVCVLFCFDSECIVETFSSRKTASRRSILSALSLLRRKPCSKNACLISKRTLRRAMLLLHELQHSIDVKNYGSNTYPCSLPISEGHWMARNIHVDRGSLLHRLPFCTSVNPSSSVVGLGFAGLCTSAAAGIN